MSNRHHLLWKLLLGAYLALGLLYVVVTPPFEASDEIHHYPVVRNIALGLGLPVQQLGVETAWAQEGSQPPAYYAAAAGLTFWIDTSDFVAVHVPNPFARTGIPGTPQNANQTRAPAELLALPGFPTGTFLAVYIIRCFSLVLGAGTVTCAYMLARRVFDDGWRPLMTGALVAFNPMFLFISASVNNDNLVWLEASLVLVIVSDIVLGPQVQAGEEFGAGRWDAPALGLLLGLAALTKISGLLLWPIVGVALFVQAWRTGTWRRFFINGLLIVIVGSLAGGWWYVRNFSLYGEFLGIERMAAIAGIRPVSFSLALLPAEWRGFAESFWGVFGAFSILAPSGTYEWYLFLSILAIAGLMAVAARSWSAVSWRSAVYAILALFVALTGIGVIRWTLMTMASQGRLMFTAIAPISMCMVLGLGRLTPRHLYRPLTGVMVAVLGWLALRAAAVAIAPAYLPPRPISAASLPSTFRPLNIAPAPGVMLLGYAADSSIRYKPGDDIVVTLYWQAAQAPAADYSVFLHVLSRGTTLVGSVDSWPGGGLRPTSYWQAGDIYPDRYVIHLSDGPAAQDAMPSLLQLGMGMWATNPDHPFPITGANGAPVPSVSIQVGQFETDIYSTPPPTTQPVAEFDSNIHLAAAPLRISSFANVPWQLPLWWKTDSVIDQDFTVFIHAVDGSGQIQAQADSPPVSGFWPTSVWRPADWVADSHRLLFPSAGKYHVLVGLYEPSSGSRLAAWRINGEAWQNGEVDLGEVTVK